MRSKKLALFNNKGGVGKTTLAFHLGVEFAKKGYKTVLMDLDAQCNLTRQALGDSFYEQTLFSSLNKTVYDVLKGVVEGGSDVDTKIPFERVPNCENLYLLRGDTRLYRYERVLPGAFSAAARGEGLGFFQTSAIQRYLAQKGMDEEVDVYIIDTSPNLNDLNQAILLSTDFFVVPLMPDAFSLQGIENLGTVFEEWKSTWKNTAVALSNVNSIEGKNILRAEGTFIGYILNSYNVYGQKPIKDHKKWIEQIPGKVKSYLSERHSKNGLVSSSQTSLGDIQDFGRLPSISHQKGIAIFDIDPVEAEATQLGTRENIEKAKSEFGNLSNAILEILHKY